MAKKKSSNWKYRVKYYRGGILQTTTTHKSISSVNGAVKAALAIGYQLTIHERKKHGRKN